MVSREIESALVTGGTGYIGSLLTDFLRRGIKLPKVVSVGSSELDVRDEKAVREIIERERPDVVFHLAAKAETEWCEDHFEEALEVNVEGSLNVARFGLEGGCRVVYFSSACLYPDNKKAYDESGPIAALCKYTETKLQAERALEPYADRILNVRMRQPFSNHRHARNLVQKLAGYTAFIDEPNAMSHLEECIPVVYELARRGVLGPINITNEGWTTPFRIANLIREHLNPDMQIEKISYEELLKRLRAVRVNSLVDCSRLHGIGYMLKPIEEAIVDSLRNPCDLGEFEWSIAG